MSLTTLAQPARERKPLFSGSPIAHVARVAPGRFAVLKNTYSLVSSERVEFLRVPAKKDEGTLPASVRMGVDGQMNACCLLLWVRRYFEVVEVPSDGQPRMRACANLWLRFNLLNTT